MCWTTHTSSSLSVCAVVRAHTHTHTHAHAHTHMHAPGPRPCPVVEASICRLVCAPRAHAAAPRSDELAVRSPRPRSHCPVNQLACDGLWEVFSNQGAVDFVRRSLKRGDPVPDAADLLAREALRRGVSAAWFGLYIRPRTHAHPLLILTCAARVVRQPTTSRLRWFRSPRGRALSGLLHRPPLSQRAVAWRGPSAASQVVMLQPPN